MLETSLPMAVSALDAGQDSQLWDSPCTDNCEWETEETGVRVESSSWEVDVVVYRQVC